MLLLLINLFSNYDLFHCNQDGQANLNKTQLSAQMHRSIREIDTLLRDFQQEIRKQKSVLKTVDLEDHLKDVGLFDYSFTPMWWGETNGADQTGRNISATTFLPTPVGHGITNFSEDKAPKPTKNPWENLNPLPGIQLNSSSGPLDIFPIAWHLPDNPDYHIDQPPFTLPTLTPFSTFPSLYPYYLTLYPTNATSIFFTRPSYPFSVPPRTAPSPEPVAERQNFNEDYLPGSPSTWIGPLKPINLARPPVEIDIPTATAGPTRLSPRPETTTRVSTLFPRPPLSLPVLRGPFIYNPKTSTVFNFFTMSKRMQERADYTHETNKRITNANRITPMTHRPRKIGRTLSKAQAWVRNRQWTKPSKPGRTSGERTREGLRTSAQDILHPAITVQTERGTGDLFVEDAEGFLYVTLPSSIIEPVTTPPTTAGDVFYAARNFTRPSLVELPANQVYHDMMHEYDEEYMTVFLIELSRLIAMKREEDLKKVLFHTELQMRSIILSGDIVWVGDRILKLLTSIALIGSQASMVDLEILRSYAGMINHMLMEREMILSDEMNSVIDKADLMYEDHEGEALFDAVREFDEYPNVTKTSEEICLNLFKTFLRPYIRLRTSARTQGLIDSINKLLIQKFSWRRANGELPMLGGTATTKPNRSRLRKRIHNSLKRRNSVKRHLINRTKHRRQVIQAAEYLMMRSKQVTPRKLRTNAYLNIQRPTNEFFYRRLGRPLHPPNGMLQFFPQVTKELENKRRMQPTEVSHLLKDILSQKRPGRMKANLIRRIVEDSSYSDEEALLKMNLRGA